MEKIIIKTDRGTDTYLSNMIRHLFPECEVSVLMDSGEGVSPKR